MRQKGTSQTWKVLLKSEAPCRNSAPLVLPESQYSYLEDRKQPKNKSEELRPAPDNEPFPQKVDKEAGKSILIRRGKKSNDPRDDIALW